VSGDEGQAVNMGERFGLHQHAGKLDEQVIRFDFQRVQDRRWWSVVPALGRTLFA
jgi:hypothetical protein